MEVIAMTDNAEVALEKVIRFRADVILTDVLLSNRDGFWVLEQVKAMQAGCVCIMISAMDSDSIVRRAIALGAEYYMAKPIQGELLVERIMQLLESERKPRSSMEYQFEEKMYATRTTFSNLEAEISGILSRMGISASIKGYHYLRKAILMGIEDSDVLIGITKGLYPDIAKIYKTSASKVERAIRHAIESAWKKNGQQVYFEFAGYHEEHKPTNGQLIATLTEYFRLRAEEDSKKIS